MPVHFEANTELQGCTLTSFLKNIYSPTIHVNGGIFHVTGVGTYPYQAPPQTVAVAVTILD